MNTSASSSSLAHIIQDDIKDLVNPKNLPAEFSWDNIEHVALKLGEAWTRGYRYAEIQFSEARP